MLLCCASTLTIERWWVLIEHSIARGGASKEIGRKSIHSAIVGETMSWNYIQRIFLLYHFIESMPFWIISLYRQSSPLEYLNCNLKPTKIRIATTIFCVLLYYTNMNTSMSTCLRLTNHYTVHYKGIVHSWLCVSSQTRIFYKTLSEMDLFVCLFLIKHLECV